VFLFLMALTRFLTQLLALLGRHGFPALAQLLALLGRQILPAVAQLNSCSKESRLAQK
jgi:hypothetical protein